jgi:hypothetical protein
MDSIQIELNEQQESRISYASMANYSPSFNETANQFETEIK